MPRGHRVLCTCWLLVFEGGATGVGTAIGERLASSLPDLDDVTTLVLVVLDAAG